MPSFGFLLPFLCSFGLSFPSTKFPEANFGEAVRAAVVGGFAGVGTFANTERISGHRSRVVLEGRVPPAQLMQVAEFTTPAKGIRVQETRVISGDLLSGRAFSAWKGLSGLSGLMQKLEGLSSVSGIRNLPFEAGNLPYEEETVTEDLPFGSGAYTSTQSGRESFPLLKSSATLNSSPGFSSELLPKDPVFFQRGGLSTARALPNAARSG